MAKAERYEAPELPEDFKDELQPELDTRIAAVKGRYDNARSSGYQFYQDARAQQRAAEGFLERGDKINYNALIKGVPGGPNGGGLQGVDSMDDMARLWWDRAREYKAELDKLEAEKAVKDAKAKKTGKGKKAEEGKPDGEK